MGSDRLVGTVLALGVWAVDWRRRHSRSRTNLVRYVPEGCSLVESGCRP